MQLCTYQKKVIHYFQFWTVTFFSKKFEFIMNVLIGMPHIKYWEKIITFNCKYRFLGNEELLHNFGFWLRNINCQKLKSKRNFNKF